MNVQLRRPHAAPLVPAACLLALAGPLLSACSAAAASHESTSRETLATESAERDPEREHGDRDARPREFDTSANLELDQERDARRRASELALAGQYAEARDILTRLLVDSHLASARELLGAGNPQDGLLWVDRALELDESSEEALLLRGEGSFALAEQLAAEGQGAVFVTGAFEDALRAFQEAGDSPRALLGASRAAHQLDRAEVALDYARRGLAAAHERPNAPAPEILPQRTYSEASYLAFTRAKQAAAGEAVYKPLYEEAQQALTTLLGETPADPWVWNRLAYLHEWEGDFAGAQAKLVRGLDIVPDDGEMLQHLVDVSRKLPAGPDAVIAVLEPMLVRNPEVAATWKTLAMERFERAMKGLESGGKPASEFEAAEQEFARARTLDPELEGFTRGYEIMCRNGLGWCRYNQDDLEGAEAAFRSMDELLPGGIAWQIQGRLLSGVQGLHFVAAGYSARSDAYAGNPAAKPEYFARAAHLYDEIRVLEPTDPVWANNAGFFHRDAGTDAAFVGGVFCRAARGEVADQETLAALRRREGLTAEPNSAAERAAFVQAGNRNLERARRHMEESYAAYLEAARMAPDDVNIVNDTALIAIYHLYRDFDRAEEMLLHCVELGAEQIQDESLSEDARWSLQNAWGDAHQNLGILYFHHRGDMQAARDWFERSVEIGPEPRPLLTEVYLPLIEAGSLEGAPPYVTEFLNWGRPCAE